MGRWTLAVGTVLSTLVAGAVFAVDIGVVPTKLILADRGSTPARAKLLYLARDYGAGISKGGGADVDRISAQFAVTYRDGSVSGAFALPAGASDGSVGWLMSGTAAAKYVNRAAPGGPTKARMAVVKSGKLLKLVGAGLGDVELDLVNGGDPGPDGVRTALCVTNAGEVNCHCSHFTDCRYKAMGGGTGAKLVCRTGSSDPECEAVPAAATTTTTFPPGSPVCCYDPEGPGECLGAAPWPGEPVEGVIEACLGVLVHGVLGEPGSVCDASNACQPPPGAPGTCCVLIPGVCTMERAGGGNCPAGTQVSGAICSAGTCQVVAPTSTSTTTTTLVGGCHVDTGLTVLDVCNDLEWEKKNAANGTPGLGVADPGNLHDVDNQYTWAGQCSANPGVWCQPNAPAAVTCAAETGAALGCGVCTAADGDCVVDPLHYGTGITTIWDWINQVNAEALGGHTDWRLPTSGGSLSFPTGEPAELESLVDPTAGLCGEGFGPCVDPMVGPTAASGYWSASTNGTYPYKAYLVGFSFGYAVDGGKYGPRWIRAVRPSS